MMEFLFLLAGIGLGSLITFLFLKSKSAESDNLKDYELKINELEKQKLVFEERLNFAIESSKKISEELTGEREKLNTANLRLAKAEETFTNMKEKLSTQKSEVDELQKKFSLEFENVANRLLEEKSKKFTEQNKTNLDSLLNPLKEKIQQFEKKVEESYDKELRDKISLREEVKKLYDLNTRISEEANNLTKALKGDNKKQGNWGEMILEKILERSGLIKDQEYKLQVSLMSEEGKRIQPDAIIFLPDNKHVIIDSKVSLIAYEGVVNSETESDREKFIKEHIASVKNHIKGLSEKNYQSSSGIDTPDFVLLFIPIESSFGMAVQADQEIFNYAWERKIVLVSPSTLLATLRTISSIWKQERQTKNALEIAEQSGKLYDKFVSFTEDMNKVGERIQGTQKAYDDAVKKLSEGNGNIISRIENLRKLGAKNTKTLTGKLINPEELPILED